MVTKSGVYLVGNPVEETLLEKLNQRLETVRPNMKVTDMTTKTSTEKEIIRHADADVEEILREVVYVEMIFAGLDARTISLTFHLKPHFGEVNPKVSKAFLNVPFEVREQTVKFCFDEIVAA